GAPSRQGPARRDAGRLRPARSAVPAAAAETGRRRQHADAGPAIDHRVRFRYVDHRPQLDRRDTRSRSPVPRPYKTITMSHFSYQNGVLNAESTPLSTIAEQFGTPTYVYSKAALLDNFGAYADACTGRDALVCYAMKANSNLAVVDLLARQGAGFDIVSGGELLRVIAAGGAPGKVIFSGVGKTVDEMKLALDQGILCFNVESIPELHRINEVAGRVGKRAPVSLRVNPNVDAKP